MNKRAHNFITGLMFPDLSANLVNAVNHALDESAGTEGPRHRVGTHDPYSAAMIGKKVAEGMGVSAEKGVTAAWAHTMVEDPLSDLMTQVKIGPSRLTLKKLFDFYTENFDLT